jgi:hypothetical protein
MATDIVWCYSCKQFFDPELDLNGITHTRSDHEFVASANKVLQRLNKKRIAR